MRFRAHCVAMASCVLSLLAATSVHDASSAAAGGHVARTFMRPTCRTLYLLLASCLCTLLVHRWELRHRITFLVARSSGSSKSKDAGCSSVPPVLLGAVEGGHKAKVL